MNSILELVDKHKKYFYQMEFLNSWSKYNAV